MNNYFLLQKYLIQRLQIFCFPFFYAAVVFLIMFLLTTVLMRHSEPVTIPEGYSAVFCHSVQRCPACRKVERLVHSILKTNGKIQFVSLEYDVPGNQKFVQRFDIGTATVILIEKKGGQIVRSKDLTQKIWENIDDDVQLKIMLEKEMSF